MARIDLYRNAHKGQRAHLFELAVALGRADPGGERSTVADRLRGAVTELRRHADNEERFIHPLLQARAPDIARALEREHGSVEDALADVEEQVRRWEDADDPLAAGAELYGAWCRMVSAYLAHLDNEERLAMPALWRTCSDEEIFAVIRRFVASRSAADQLDDLRAQVPALAPHERAALVGGVMRSGALPTDRLWVDLADVLPPADLARLRADLAA